MFIDGVKTVLADVPDIQITGEALNGKQVLELLKTIPADIVLLDINMPELDGIETARFIKKSYNQVKIIMLTQFGERGFVRKCIEIGVEGYLLKDCSKEELISAIRTVKMGNTLYKFNNSSVNNDKCKKDIQKLTQRELQVIRLMVRDMTYWEITKELRISIYAVRTYRDRLLTKTGTSTIAGLVQWANDNEVL
jgi:DNA-binding NarL/FixJ family response regulator